ncbi:MAG: flippase-like domain-containing protein [Candidatus Omnitrophica bacterium]|nr:flippase-like domain-containing protein [Candidatus Omnitrophota bacterium]
MKSKKQLRACLKIVVSICLVVWLAGKSDIRAIRETWQNFNADYFLGVLTIVCLNIYLSTKRWQILVERFDQRPDFRQLLKYNCLSRFYNVYVPGNFAGDVIRGLTMHSKTMGQTQIMATVFMDRFIGLGCFLLIGAVGVLGAFPIFMRLHLIQSILLGALIIGVCFIVLINGWMVHWFKPAGSFHQKIMEGIKTFLQYLSMYRHARGIIFMAGFLSILIALNNVFVFYVTSLGIEAGVSLKYFLYFIPIINLLSYVPFTYSGLGVREGLMVYCFSAVGVSREVILSLSLLYFVWLIMMATLSGGVSLLIPRQRAVQ